MITLSRGNGKAPHAYPPPRTVADVQHFDPRFFFHYSIDCAVDVRFVPVQQMPELVAFWCDWAPVRLFFQTEYRLLDASIPFQGGAGALGIDIRVQLGKIPLGASG